MVQAREGEFRVPHQEQSNLDPYSSPSNDEEVRYPTIGQRKPAAHKVALCMISMRHVYKSIKGWLPIRYCKSCLKASCQSCTGS